MWTHFQHLARMQRKDVKPEHQRYPMNPGVAPGKLSTPLVRTLETYPGYPLPLDIHASLRRNQDLTNGTSSNPIDSTVVTEKSSPMDGKSQDRSIRAAEIVASQSCPNGCPSYAKFLDGDGGSKSIPGEDLLSTIQWQYEMMSNPGSTPTRSFDYNPPLAAGLCVGLSQAQSHRGLKTILSSFPCWTGLLSFVSSAKASPLRTGPSAEARENPAAAAVGISVAISLAILSVAATATLAFRYRRRLRALCCKTKSKSIDVSCRFLEAIRKNDKVIAGSGMTLSLIAWNMYVAAQGKNSPWSLLVGVSWFAATATFMIRQCRILKYQEGYVMATVAVAALLSVVLSAMQRGNADSIITLMTLWGSIVSYLLAEVWPRR